MHSRLALSSWFRRLALALGLSSFALGLVGLEGCSRQKEGERCDPLNGNRDCDDQDTLVCTNAAELRPNDGIDRCCPKERNDYTDNRCAPRAATGDGDGDGMGGAEGSGGSSASGGMGGGASGGSSGLPENAKCQFTSNCATGLYCNGGICGKQCSEDIDCAIYGLSACTEEGSCVDE